MCLIVHREPGTTGRGSNIPNEVITYNARLNPDGFGLAWRENDGELKSVKFGPKDFASFNDLLKNLDRDTGIEYVAHFRKATHGPSCERLSHPFVYEDKKDGQVLVFHNGIIGIDTPNHESDTSVFVKEVLAELKPRWWANHAFKFLVEEAIGYSRLLIMTAQETVRLNSKLWDKIGGIHYSTDPYPPRPKIVVSEGGYAFTGEGSAYGYQPRTNLAVPVVVSGKGTEPSVVVNPKPATTVGTTGVVAWNDETFDSDDAWVAKNGHAMSPLGEAKTDKVNDVYGTAICETCHTIGDYYVIDGKAYVDVNHFFVDDATDNTNEEAEYVARLDLL